MLDDHAADDRASGARASVDHASVDLASADRASEDLASALEDLASASEDRASEDRAPYSLAEATSRAPLAACSPSLGAAFFFEGDHRKAAWEAENERERKTSCQETSQYVIFRLRALR